MEIILGVALAVAVTACIVIYIKGTRKVSQSEHDKAKAEYRSLENEFLAKKSALEYTEDQLALERDAHARERTKNEAMTTEIRLKSEHNAAAQQNIENLQAQLHSTTRLLEQEKAALATLQQALTETKDHHHTEVTQLKEALAGAQSEAKAAAERLKEVAAQLVAEQQAHQALAAEAKSAAESHTQTMQETMSQHHQDLSEYKQKLATAEAQLKAGQERLTEQQAFLEETRKKMEETFAQLASRSLDTANDRYQTQNSESLIKMLTPFREQIESFKKEVTEKHVLEIADRNTLKGEIKKIVELNQTLSQQTQDLTRALSSQAREQGAYGEDILETILTNAGMIRNENYTVQDSGYNEAGERIRPDFIIRCPDNREIIVDSKVSLTAYVRYCNECHTDEERKAAQADVYKSIKAHIEGLSGKKYQTMKDRAVAGLVLMFMPFEGAYTVAAGHKNDLRELAFRNEIFLVTPSNLLLVVKLVTDLWQRDTRDRNTKDIIDRAHKLYEKAQDFLNDFDTMGKSLDATTKFYQSALKKLTSGNDNMVLQGLKLKKLIGTRPGKGNGKQMPQKYIDLQDGQKDIELPPNEVEVIDRLKGISGPLHTSDPTQLAGGLPG